MLNATKTILNGDEVRLRLGTSEDGSELFEIAISIPGEERPKRLKIPVQSSRSIALSLSAAANAILATIERRGDEDESAFAYKPK